MGPRSWIIPAVLLAAALSGACIGLEDDDGLDDREDRLLDRGQDLNDQDEGFEGPSRTDGTPAPEQASQTGAFAPGPCPFEPEVAVEVECGWLAVPESRVGLSDDSIEVAVAILRTPTSDPAPDPVVFLHGGLGGVALAERWAWLSDLDRWQDHPILATRDLVLVDQRDTGYSRPSLTCSDVEDPSDSHDRFAVDGITLAAYTTPENAADLAALREGLGYDEWNLLGSSYGTRLGAAIVRDHPDGVRSLILDGVYPLDVVPAYHEYPANTVAAFTELDRLADDGWFELLLDSLPRTSSLPTTCVRTGRSGRPSPRNVFRWRRPCPPWSSPGVSTRSPRPPGAGAWPRGCPTRPSCRWRASPTLPSSGPVPHRALRLTSPPHAGRRWELPAGPAQLPAGRRPRRRDVCRQGLPSGARSGGTGTAGGRRRGWCAGCSRTVHAGSPRC